MDSAGVDQGPGDGNPGEGRPGDAGRLPQVRLGGSDIQTAPLGVGTWAWGDRRVWHFDPERGPQQAAEAFAVSVAGGVTLFDTAEIYGGGVSERILGRLVREHRGGGAPIVVVTKFAPLPTRFTSGSLLTALDRSLERLKLPQVDLYLVHWPYTWLSKSGLAERLAEAVAAGKTRAVGVSNYSADAMKRCHDQLAGRGVPLACNQVEYSLVKRGPERNGVLDACRERDVALMAYSPLGLGALTGKYGPGSCPEGRWRRMKPAFRRWDRMVPLLDSLQRIATRHGRTPSQVALNWLAAQPGVIPIPGARNGEQARDNAGAITFRLTSREMEEIEVRSRPWR